MNAPSAAGIMGDREEALVHSGVALAGVNQRWSGDGEDGILTALETAGLDLWGTGSSCSRRARRASAR